MISQNVITKIKQKICEEITIEEENEHLYRINTPFGFDDGDSYLIFLEWKPDGYIISDRGHTLMHISYWTDTERFFEGRRGKTLEAIINRFGLNFESGEIKLRTAAENIGEAVFHYLQALDKITDMEYLDREQIRTLFVEDVVHFVQHELERYNPKKDWHDRETDPEGKYKAHVALGNRNKMVLVYALAGDDVTRDATISLHYLSRSNIRYKSVGIFRDQEIINRRVLARFTDVCERQYSSFFIG